MEFSYECDLSEDSDDSISSCSSTMSSLSTCSSDDSDIFDPDKDYEDYEELLMAMSFILGISILQADEISNLLIRDELDEIELSTQTEKRNQTIDSLTDA